MEDVSPALLEQIQAYYNEHIKESGELYTLGIKIKTGQATYDDAYKYAEEVGKILSEAFANVLSPDVLPDGKLYFNIAKSLLEPTLGQNFELVTAYTRDVQQLLNSSAGLGIKAVTATPDQERLHNLFGRVCDNEESFTTAQKVLEEPIINYTLHVVDQTQKANLDLHKKAGLQPVIKRTTSGKCCSWCSNLAGTYNYPEDVPDDIYRRHRYCRCAVIYDPKDNRGVQDVNDHSTWYKDESTLKQRINYNNSAITNSFGVKEQEQKIKRRTLQASKVSTKTMSMKELRQHENDLKKQLQAQGKTVSDTNSTTREELSTNVLNLRKQLYFSKAK